MPKSSPSRNPTHPFAVPFTASTSFLSCPSHTEDATKGSGMLRRRASLSQENINTCTDQEMRETRRLGRYRHCGTSLRSSFHNAKPAITTHGILLLLHQQHRESQTLPTRAFSFFCSLGSCGPCAPRRRSLQQVQVHTAPLPHLRPTKLHSQGCGRFLLSARGCCLDAVGRPFSPQNNKHSAPLHHAPLPKVPYSCGLRPVYFAFRTIRYRSRSRLRSPVPTKSTRSMD
mmetsp:Transcript_15885/g.48421  ORF Transcript_15885/g.48421 Transcript_15885/m.48421 type:complete len:229 (+) Transcript_15885:1028-1714(+)